MSESGTDCLCRLLYGEKDIKKILGGSDAQFLKDACQEISELRAEVERLEEEKTTIFQKHRTARHQLEKLANNLLKQCQHVGQTEQENAKLRRVVDAAVKLRDCISETRGKPAWDAMTQFDAAIEALKGKEE